MIASLAFTWATNSASQLYLPYNDNDLSIEVLSYSYLNDEPYWKEVDTAAPYLQEHERISIRLLLSSGH